jgi:hypothetical protein
MNSKMEFEPGLLEDLISQMAGNLVFGAISQKEAKAWIGATF